MTAQLMTDQCETFQKIELVSDAELLGEVCRASPMAIPRSVVSRHTTAWTVSVRRSSEWTPVLSNLVPIPLPHFAGRPPQGRRQERRTEAAPTIVGSGGGPRTHWTSSRATAHLGTKLPHEQKRSPTAKSSEESALVPQYLEDPSASSLEELRRARRTIGGFGPQLWFQEARAEAHIPQKVSAGSTRSAEREVGTKRHEE